MQTKKGMSGGVVGLLGLAILAGAVLVGTGAVSLSALGGEDANMRSMADATADLRVIADDADTVYMAAPDAEVPDEYGDYTADASTISSETDGDVYEVTVTDGEGTINNNNIGPNQDFKPGETYTVWSEGTNAELEFDEVTIPAETESFKVENEISEEVVVETLGTAVYGDTEEEILTASGEVASDDTDVSTGFNDRVTDIYDDGEFTLSTEVEVDEGDSVLGEVSSVSVDGSDVVNNVNLEIRADGETVYSESADAGDISDLNMDLVEDEMERNPVFSSEDIEVVADVEFDDTRTSGDSNVDMFSMTLNDLYGNSVYSTTVTG